MTQKSASHLSPLETVRSLHDIWNSGNASAINTVYSEDFVAHWPPNSETPERRGIDGIRLGVARIRGAFPDWHVVVLDLLRPATRWQAATNRVARIVASIRASSRPGVASRPRRFRSLPVVRTGALSSNGA